MKLLIVNFHYYRKEKCNSGIYPTSPEQFTSQIALLSKHYAFVSQQQICAWIEEKKYPDGNYCLITFDDGLREQMDAYKWMLLNKISAIFYVPVKPLMEKCVLDVHKLHLIRTKLTDEDLLNRVEANYELTFGETEKNLAAAQYRYDSPLTQKLKYLLNFVFSETQKKELVDQSFTELFGEESAFSDSFYMSENDLKVIASSGMLGSHGYGHLPLATLSKEKAIADIQNSLDYLQKVTQDPVLSFSYPYGSKAAVNTGIALFVKQAGHKFALTMWRGINTESDAGNPFLLKRVDTNDAPGGKKEIPYLLPAAQF